MKVQPRLKDKRGRSVHRESMPSCIPPEMKDWVRSQMRRFDCSGSWVVAVALSDVSGLPVVRPEEVRKLALVKKRKTA